MLAMIRYFGNMYTITAAPSSLQVNSRPFGSNRSLRNDNDMIGKVIHLVEEVRRQDNRVLATFGQQYFPYFLTGLRIKTTGYFINAAYLATCSEHHRQLKLSFLPTAEG